MSVLENHVDEQVDKPEVVVTEAMIEGVCSYLHSYYNEVELEILVEQALLAVLSKTELLSCRQKTLCVQDIFLYPH